MGYHFHLPGIFLTQESNPHLLDWQGDPLPLSHQGRPKKTIVCVCQPFRLVQLSVTPWTAARQPPLSLGPPGQEHGSRLPFPSPGYPSNPGTGPGSPALKVDSLPSEPPGTRRPLLLFKTWNKVKLLPPATPPAIPRVHAASSLDS